MAKKFKAGGLNAEPAPTGMRITLPEYIRLHAPDALNSLAVMEGVPALQFWPSIFQPPRPGEGQKWVGDALRWPYAERLIYLAREFAKLDERCRRYVVKAARAGIWWRGDDIGRFRCIVAAHLKYRGLSEAERADYRRGLMSAAKLLAASRNTAGQAGK